MVIFTSDEFTIPFGNEIRNYSVINDFNWSQEKINKSLEFFNEPNVYPQCHGWNHTNEEGFNWKTLNEAEEIIFHTLWNWKNNFNITPNFFLGRGTSGNYNITLALKKFSESYWTVYGENFRWNEERLFPDHTLDGPAVEYIGKKSYVKRFDPLFGNSWGNPCTTLYEAQELFKNSYNEDDCEMIFIRGHPGILNRKDQQKNLSLWEDWIDWIYLTHDLININHTQAIYYNIDRQDFKIIRTGEENYTIDLTGCKYDHNLLISPPNQLTSIIWTLIDENGNYIDTINEDKFVNLSGEKKYFLASMNM